jgi:hypothetical protein
MNHGRLRACPAVWTAVLAATLWGGASAQNGEDADADEASVAKACLDQPTIERTRILNDRNIVFVTQDGIYNDELPRQCPSLRRGSLVNYAVANRELCAGSQFQEASFGP